MNNIALGIYGEKLALKYLKKQKYKILEKNFRCALGEIDIVAKDGGFLVFVEVKTRSSNAFGEPMEAVDFYKQRKLSKLAVYYQKLKRKLDVPVRFDVVDIVGEQITLIKSAFESFK